MKKHKHEFKVIPRKNGAVGFVAQCSCKLFLAAPRKSKRRA